MNQLALTSQCSVWTQQDFDNTFMFIEVLFLLCPTNSSMNLHLDLLL